MIKIFVFAAFLIKIVYSIFPFDDVPIIIDNKVINGEELDYLALNFVEPTLDPTLQPFFDYNVNSLTPTSLSTIMPSLSPSFKPTFRPTIMPTPKNIKKIEFDVNMKLSNFSKLYLDENDKEILLVSFGNITHISREYLLIKNKNRIRRRNLYSVNNIFNDIYYIISISIPLVNKYIIYDSDPIKLYDSLSNLIINVTNTGLLLSKIKEVSYIYNSTSFTNINVNLIGIDEPIIKIINDHRHKNTIAKKTVLIITLTLGLFVVISLVCVSLYSEYNRGFKYYYKFKLLCSHIININKVLDHDDDKINDLIYIDVEDKNNSDQIIDNNSFFGLIDIGENGALIENGNTNLSIIEIKENEGNI